RAPRSFRQGAALDAALVAQPRSPADQPDEQHQLAERDHEEEFQRRHPAAVAVAGVVVLGLLGDVAYAIYAAPQRNKPASKARRLRRAGDGPRGGASGGASGPAAGGRFGAPGSGGGWAGAGARRGPRRPPTSPAGWAPSRGGVPAAGRRSSRPASASAAPTRGSTS